MVSLVSKWSVPFVRLIFGGTGFGILSGTFVLFVMILPTVTFMTTDTLRAVPRHYREASLAMGATRWQTIWRVTLNAAKPGIFTAVIFGMARAFGEALAIQMVVGNSAVIPTSLTTPAATLTSVLTMGIGNTVMGYCFKQCPLVSRLGALIDESWFQYVGEIHYP